MLNTLEKLRDEIRLIMIDKKDFESSKMLCKNYLKLINSLDKNYSLTKDDFWFGYYNYGLSNKKLGNIKESYVYAQKSIQYTDYDIDNYRYLYSLWLIGECALHLGNIKEANKYFKECIRICIDKHEFNFKILFLFNMSIAYKNPYSMLRVIKQYEENTYDNTLPTYGDMQKDEMLQEMYETLIKLYIENNNISLAYRTLHIIKHKMVKKEVGKLLVA